MVHDCRGKLAQYVGARYKFLQARNDYITLMKECTTEDAVDLIRSRIPIPEDISEEIRRVMGKMSSDDDLCLQVTRLCHMLDQANTDLIEVTQDLKKRTLRYREQCVFNSVQEFDNLAAALDGRTIPRPKGVGGTVIAIRTSMPRAGGKGKKKKSKKRKKNKQKKKQ